MGNSDDLKIFTYCTDLSEAHVLRSKLEAEGMHPEIKDEHMHSVASHLSSFLGNIAILLPEDEHEKAQPFLNELRAPAEVSEVEKLEKKSQYAKINAILGLVAIPFVTTIYSLYLTFRIVKSAPKLSPKTRSNLVFSTVLNVVVILGWAFVIYLAGSLQEALRQLFIF